MSSAQIHLGEITAEVELKDVKNVHLSVYPPSGRVRIAAPMRMTLENVRAYAVTKLAWIKKQQRKLLEQEREQQRDYIDRESHYLWGRRYLLKVETVGGRQSVRVAGGYLILYVRPNSSKESRAKLMDEWYRELVRERGTAFVKVWQPKLSVGVNRVFVQRMKTKWGSCNRDLKNIRLNSELAKKPIQCLEYVVVHELVHLREPKHGTRFFALMTEVFPKWRFYRDQLNSLPLRAETWSD